MDERRHVAGHVAAPASVETLWTCRPCARPHSRIGEGSSCNRLSSGPAAPARSMPCLGGTLARPEGPAAWWCRRGR
jgi:hypothetical protein